jgi:branched-chain amino acid aminotransferase
MDQMLLNGQPVNEDNSSQLFNNRGFYYGDGFFESMRVEHGKILRGDMHFQRMQKALLLLEMQSDIFSSVQEIESLIASLSAANKSGDYLRARITFFRQGPGNYTPDKNSTGYLINIQTLSGPMEFPEKGLRAGIYTRQAKAKGPFSNIKSISSQLYVMAGIHAKHEGLEECLLVNTSGHFIESLSCNFFIWMNNTLLTAPLSEGCVDGVYRRYLLDIADKNGIPFREQMITETEIALADEIILSNAVRGIQWIATLGEKNYDCQMARQLFRFANS